MATEKEYLDSVQKSIETELQENVDALPAGFDNKRFALNCLAIIKDNMAGWKKDYEKVDFKSVIAAFVKGAFLDLDFFNKECYIIPYGKEANFQTDYKGEIKLAKKYSKRKIKDIYAKIVRQGDVFQPQIKDGVQSVNYTPEPFNDKDIIGTFAVVLYEDGGMNYEDMSKAEIESIRKAFSKAPNSPAWTKTPGEMYKKTVLRRLLKMIDLHFDNTEQQEAFTQGGDATFDKEVVIDTTATEAVDPFQDAKAETVTANSDKTSPVEPEPQAAQQEPPSIYDDVEQIDLASLGV